MRFNYLIYPAAHQKLKESGIAERIRELEQSEEGLPYLGGATFANDIVQAQQELSERGCFKHLPPDFADTYKRTMNAMLQDPEKFFWAVHTPQGERKIPCEYSDMLLFLGEPASYVLSPEEIWDYERFGFSSPTGFVATVGAFMKATAHIGWREGYKWHRKRRDGTEILTEVTGDMHSDLRILLTDITPHPTTDPFGQEIEMRPSDDDTRAVAAHHSTEEHTLIIALKYLERCRQMDKVPGILEWGRSLGQQIIGTCTEQLFPNSHLPCNFLFIGYEHPLPELDENNKIGPHVTDWIPTSSGSYGAYVTHEGDLALSYQTDKNREQPKKPISATFPPEDAEELVKGLIYQCAKGLGRTRVERLLELLEYRTSEQFVKDREEERRISEEHTKQR